MRKQSIFRKVLIMLDELLFIPAILVSFALVLIAFGLGKEWLYSLLVVYLILITVAGARLVSVFGYTTNIGNIFYAMVFLIGQLLVERNRKAEAYKSVWIGFFSIFAFVLMTPFLVRYGESGDVPAFGHLDFTVFALVPRTALASVLAFVLSQNLNIRVYQAIMQRTGKNFVWLRSACATVSGQLLDSAIFFPFAFLGTVNTTLLFESAAVGFGVKVVVGFLGIAVIYAVRFLTRGKTQ